MWSYPHSNTCRFKKNSKVQNCNILSISATMLTFLIHICWLKFAGGGISTPYNQTDFLTKVILIAAVGLQGISNYHSYLLEKLQRLYQWKWKLFVTFSSGIKYEKKEQILNAVPIICWNLFLRKIGIREKAKFWCTVFLFLIAAVKHSLQYVLMSC